MDKQKEETNLNKVKSPMKRKSKFANCSSRENDTKRKKFIHDNLLGEKKKEH